MGTILIKSKCGQNVIVEKEKFSDEKEALEFKEVILKNGDEHELDFYDFKKPNRIIIQTEKGYE